MSPTPSDTRNEDWTKSTWDIWVGYKLVSTLDELEEYCARQHISLDQFLTLPAAEAMPDELKEEAALYRQERMAGRMREGRDGSGGVVERMQEVLEKGILRRVRTPEGARQYGQPIGTPIKPDIIPSKPSIRPDVPRTPSGVPTPSAQAGQKGGHYGTFTVDEYLDQLSEGAFPSWTTAYKAAWLSPGGELDAVADHDAIPGGREGAFVSGSVRVAIAGHGTKQISVNYQVRGKANSRQVSAMLKLMEELDSNRAVVAVHGNERGEGEPVNGEFTFPSVAALRAFLNNPTRRPEVNERAASLSQFKEGEEGETKQDGEVEDGGEGGLEEKATVRKVRTPGGARLYDQPIGSVIRPDVGVVGALTRAVTGGRRGTHGHGKPMEVFNERERRLETDSDYRAKFEKELDRISRPLPDRHLPLDPASKNPQYRAYVDDLNRRLAHAMVEPGPMHWDPETKILDMEGRRLADRLAADVIAEADARGVPRDRQAVVAAGVSGAGKTTVLKRKGRELAGLVFAEPKDDEPQNFAVANADNFKERLIPYLPAEYAALGINPNETAPLTHELSSNANKALLSLLINGGYNFVLDGTYEGAMIKRDKEIARLRDAEYEITAVLVDGKIETSLQRAAGRHIKIQALVPRDQLPNVDLGRPGEIDRLGIPGGGYAGRYVPVGQIAEQVPRDEPVRSASGEVVERPSWGGEWESANAQNFQRSIEAGYFDRWIVVGSGGETVASGEGRPVNRESLVGVKEATMEASPSPTPETRVNRSPARTWLAGEPPGTYPLIEAVVRYNEGDGSWEDVVETLRRMERRPTQGLAELGWHGVEDEFPQPGTQQELLAASFAKALTDDEYEQLHELWVTGAAEGKAGPSA